MTRTNIRNYDATLRHYGHAQEPQKLDDMEWASRLLDLHYIRKQEEKSNNT